MSAEPAYLRPRLSWVKRRARRLQRFYGVERRVAVFDAWADYIEFCLGTTAQLMHPSGEKA